MKLPKFDKVRTWVFDLDNTLYPPAMRLFDQIETKMTNYVAQALNVTQQAANTLRHDYWHDYGTTLAGLMTHHDIDPEHYLDAVHDIDFSILAPDPHLAELISALPGRKIVYTNGSAPYAAKVLAARGLEAAFDAIYGVEDGDYRPKPHGDAFEKVFAKDGLDPHASAMFEDDPRNLAVPHEMGLQTVLVGPEPQDLPHVHHNTDDLNGFLKALHRSLTR
jgi:putative hydrolase of the HAD superfamily